MSYQLEQNMNKDWMSPNMRSQYVQSPNMANIVIANQVSTPEPIGINLSSCQLLHKTIEEIHKNFQTPFELGLMTSLAAISISCQNLIDVELPRINEKVPTSLMLFVIAESGEGKSMVKKKLFESIQQFETTQLDLYEQQNFDWEEDKSIIQKKKKGLEDAIRKLASKGEDTLEQEQQLKELNKKLLMTPRKIRLLYENSTTEALFSGLHNDFPAVGLVSSEGVNIFKSAAFKDVGKMNAIWSGEYIFADRAKSPSYQIKNSRLTVLAMAQPTIFDRYLEKEGESARGSGLLARALMYQAQSKPTDKVVGKIVSWEHIHDFNKRVKCLLEENIIHVDQKREREVVRFSREAAEAWCKYFSDVESQKSPTGIYHEVKDHASKLAENVARVAALLHFFEGYNGDISLDTFNVARKICDMCSQYFLRKFNIRPQVEVDAEALWSWLYKHQFNPIFSCRRYIKKNDVRQGGPNQLRDTELLNKAINFLVKQGFISVVNNNGTKYIDIYPSLPQFPGCELANM